ncbi:Bromodomain-containing protein, partial [Martensiomyces pterosporus]
HPVSAEEAPDYHLFIKEPMDFGTIKRKLEEFRYRSIEVFEYDLNLVVRNCMAYNKPTTYYYQLATRVKRHIDRLMAKARA